MNTDAKTGMQPISRQARKRGGKVEGTAAAARSDRKPRGAQMDQQEVNDFVNRDVKKANAEKFGAPHDGGFKRGGRAEGGSTGGESAYQKLRSMFGNKPKSAAETPEAPAPEHGLRFQRRIARYNRERVAAAVAEVFPAIEIVENRYGDFAALGTPSLIADQVFHAAGVLGAPTPNWRALDLGATRGRMTVAGTVRGEGVGADLLGHPMEALAWLAGSDCAREFGGLRAGQVVFLGSVTPPIWLDGPCDVLVEFDTLGKVALTFT
jgi:hypothetical protein